MQNWNRLKQFNIVVLLIALIFAPTVQRVHASDNNDVVTLSSEQSATIQSHDASPIELIQLQAGVTKDEASQLVAALGYNLIEWLAPLHIAKVQVAKVQIAPVQAASVQAAAVEPQLQEEAVANALSAVQFIEPGGQVYGVGTDPALTDNFQSYGLRNIYAPEGWAKEMGSPTVVIAVIDTGLDMNNVEFSGRTVAGYDFVNYDNDPDDDNGHGTHVGGIVAAAYNNDVGTAGVCNGCSIMPVKVLDENNSGDWFAVAQGIVYAADLGADIINLSLGAVQPSNTIEQAIKYAQTSGALIVAAAGNAGSDKPFYPAAFDGVIAVSATSMNNAAWTLSNYGEYITVTAPGDNIFSTAINKDDSTSGGENGLSTRSGTSMAAPYVAGLAGLLLSQDPNRSAHELTNIIIKTATDLGNDGYDKQFGYGLINVSAALNHDQNSGNIQGVSQRLTAQIYLPFSAQE